MVIHHNLHERHPAGIRDPGGRPADPLGLLLASSVLLPVTMRIRSSISMCWASTRTGFTAGSPRPTTIGQLIKAHNGMLLHIKP